MGWWTEPADGISQAEILAPCSAPNCDGTSPSLCPPLLLSAFLRISEESLLEMGGEAYETVGGVRIVKKLKLNSGFQQSLFAHTLVTVFLSHCPPYLSTFTETGLRPSGGAVDFFCHPCQPSLARLGLLSAVWSSLTMSLQVKGCIVPLA